MNSRAALAHEVFNRDRYADEFVSMQSIRLTLQLASKRLELNFHELKSSVSEEILGFQDGVEFMAFLDWRQWT